MSSPGTPVRGSGIAPIHTEVSMADEPKRLTKEEVDAMVAEAISDYPDAKLDQELLGDIDRTSKIMHMADRFSQQLSPLCERLARESEIPPDDRRLTSFEAAMMRVIPEIYERVTPRSHVQAALLAALAVSVMAARAKLEADEDEAAEVTTGRLIGFLETDLDEVVPIVMRVPKEIQLQTATQILKRANAGRRILDRKLDLRDGKRQAPPTTTE
jgi:hypothetical protein